MVDSRGSYRDAVKTMGKKEFTFAKMQEFGFWPKDLPTPYEKQANENEEDYKKREKLTKEYEVIVNKISKMYSEKAEISSRLRSLKSSLSSTWDYETIRKHIAREIMEESIKRRKERKEQRELEKQRKSENWKKLKSENILFIGKGYSKALQDKETDEAKLNLKNLPIIKDDKDLAKFLDIEYKELRFLVYHRDVVTNDHYYRYQIPKKKGGFRNIAAPKTILKNAQRKILEDILYRIPVSGDSHGFIKGKSIVTGAKEHNTSPDLLINIDLKDFFPSISFERIRGLYKSFGYSGYIASLLAMLCTYCERMEIEIKGEKKYVKTTDRILPQGSPASPMITNIICIKLDSRLSSLSKKYGFTYSRYADDISFSYKGDTSSINYSRFLGLVSKIVKEEGFIINKEKTKFLRKHNSQRVTGIVVNNDEIGVPKKWIKTLRATIHNGNKILESGEKLPLDHIMKIKGMVSWIQSVNEKRYERIISEALILLGKCNY